VGAFKDEISAAVGAELAGELAAAWPPFPRRRFTAGLAGALEPLELSGRVDLLARRLADALPATFDEAAAVVWAALDAPSFAGWMTWPVGMYVSRAGLDRPEQALPLLAGLTPRFSSEFALRPFLERHPDTTYGWLRRWSTDGDEHVRRLVSEGTRPRLPWASPLRGLIADPTPNVTLLDALADDPSPYVRRSVANHLNDIAKDHPGLAVELAQRWHDRSAHGARVATHGLRTLIKRGDPAALAVVGVPVDAAITLHRLAVDHDRIVIGEATTLTGTIELVDGDPVDAVIDYRVHYVGARGPKPPKVFKHARRRLDRGQPVAFTIRHRFEHVSIRLIRPGPHTIDVQVNGRVLGSVVIDVAAPG
jgi:3-methyladenine DNA glycosylase AlkC